MANDRNPGIGSKGSKTKTVMLQIQRPGDDSPLKFPGVVRNLAAGVATLEVNNPWTILNWESLKKQPGRLQLLSEARETVEIQGTVTWARYMVLDQSNGQLTLGLKLANPDAAAQQLLKDHILHSSEDIKSLWDRLDQARKTPEPEAISTRIAFVAVLLFSGVVALNLAQSGPYKFFSWVLWLGGALVVAKQTLQFWKTVKATQ